MSIQNMSEQLLHEIGRKIVDGEYEPGEVLPKVEVLSESKGVSRTVTREAFKGLAARRLVRSNPRVGTTVRERNDWQWWDPDVLHWAINSNANREILMQLTEVRLAIEPAAVELATKNATTEDIEAIIACYHNLEKSAGDETAWIKADFEFHDSILFASHNELMLSLVQTLRGALVQSRKTSYRELKKDNSKHYEEVISRHKAILDAICRRDGKEANQKMYELLVRVGQLIDNHEEN